MLSGPRLLLSALALGLCILGLCGRSAGPVFPLFVGCLLCVGRFLCLLVCPYISVLLFPCVYLGPWGLLAWGGIAGGLVLRGMFLVLFFLLLHLATRS